MTRPAVRRPLRAVRAALALGTLAAAAPAAARAQFAIDKTEMVLAPGDSAARTGALLVRNDGAARAQAVVKVEDWDRAADGTNRFFPAGTQPHSCARGLTVFPRTLSLAPGESQWVRVAVDGSVGSAAECWSVVLVETVTPQVAASGRMLLYTVRTGMKLYVVPEGAGADGQVTDVTLARAPQDTARWRAEVAFENTGARHVTASGRLEVRRADDGATVAVVPLPPAYALPGATMRVAAEVPTLAAGRYVVLALMDFGGSELAAAQREHEVRATVAAVASAGTVAAASPSPATPGVGRAAAPAARRPGRPAGR